MARRIDHVVVLMLENRSFDHLFGFRAGVNGLTGNEFNLLDLTKPESPTNPRFQVSNAAPFAVPVGQGPLHSLNESSVQLCNNKDGPGAGAPARNNGFVKSYKTALHADHIPQPTNDQLEVVMECFAPGRLPALGALADAFCLCDNWFAEIPGPTHPNRLYVHAATSAGFAHNVFAQPFGFRTIYNNLQDAGLTWASYDFDDNEVRHFTQVNGQVDNFKPFTESFAADVQAGRLPNYAFILPRFLNTPQQFANSQHAPEDARHGDNLVADVYEALRANAEVWARSVLVVTYDEHGGFYDHVIPPAEGIPNPDGINSPAPGDASFAPAFTFNRLGFRVPAVIASPWVKKGLVDSTRYQHTSILATLKELFQLPSFLTKRDQSAKSLLPLLQALGAARTDTPATLPRAAVPPLGLAPDDPLHPANLPLDDTQRNMLVGALHLTQGSHPPGVSLANLPTTQGQASEYIRRCYEQHFARKAKSGPSGAPPPSTPTA
jgi:phospholipase C